MKITHEIRDEIHPFYSPTRTAHIRVDMSKDRAQGMLDLHEYRQELYRVHKIHQCSVQWFYRGSQFWLRLGGLRSQCGSETVHISTTTLNSSSGVPWGWPGIMVLTRDPDVPAGLWELMTEYFMQYRETDEEYDFVYFPPALTDVNRSTRVITRHILDKDECDAPYDEMREDYLPYENIADLTRVRWRTEGASSLCKATVLYTFLGAQSRNDLLPFIFGRLRDYPDAPVVITTNYGRGYWSEPVVEALLKRYEEGTLGLPKGVQFHWGLGSNPNEYFHDISWVMFSNKKVA